MQTIKDQYIKHLILEPKIVYICLLILDISLDFSGQKSK